MKNYTEIFRNMLEHTVRPVIKGGTLDIPEFAPLGTNYLDGVLAANSSHVLANSGMALDDKAQFAAALYLISKVKDDHDRAIAVMGDDFKSEIALDRYYANLNKALTWMSANLNRELTAVAISIMVGVLEFEFVASRVDVYRKFIGEFPVIEEFATGPLRPVMKYMESAYENGGLKWIFGDKAKPSANANADTEAPVPETGDDSDATPENASADTLIIDISGLNTADKANLRADLNAMLQDYGIGSDTGVIINPQA